MEDNELIANKAQENPVKFWKKLLLSVFICLVIYSNFWSIAIRSPLGEITKLPYQVPVLIDLFDIFSVFSYYETINRDFVIKGLPKNRYGQYDGESWVVLDINDDYFPYSLGEQHIRLFFSKYFNLGKEAHTQACKEFAAKIRTRYNKDVPIYQMRKIAIGIESWPRSKKAYRALKQEDTTSFKVLCMED